MKKSEKSEKLADVNNNKAEVKAKVKAQATENEVSIFRKGVGSTEVTVCKETDGHKGDVEVDAKTICSVM